VTAETRAADFVITGADILTMTQDGSTPQDRPSALAVRDGRIVEVGAGAGDGVRRRRYPSYCS